MESWRARFGAEACERRAREGGLWVGELVVRGRPVVPEEVVGWLREDVVARLREEGVVVVVVMEGVVHIEGRPRSTWSPAEFVKMVEGGR